VGFPSSPYILHQPPPSNCFESLGFLVSLRRYLVARLVMARLVGMVFLFVLLLLLLLVMLRRKQPPTYLPPSSSRALFGWLAGWIPYHRYQVPT